MKTQLVGSAAENLAKGYLENKGLHWISSNFTCRYGEIDLIMRDSDCIVFVEVRYRSRSDYGGGRESVDFRKQRKLIRSANWYLQKHKLTNLVARIDVVALQTLDQRSESIEWIKNAIENCG